MASVTLTDVVQGTPTDAGVINANNANLRATINGGLDNSNIAVGANIDVSKISGSFSANPTGTILGWGGATAPTGYLLCQGQSLLRSGTPPTGYTTLFGIIGTAFGTVDGSHFNLPDLRGRVPVGRGTHSDVDTIGDNEGLTAALAERTPRHSHTSDTLTLATATSGSGTGFPFLDVAEGGVGAQEDLVEPNDNNIPEDFPAFLTINYIIKF